MIKKAIQQSDIKATASLGYGITGISAGIINALAASFLLVYYTNVAHINPGTAATVIAVSKVFDAFSDLIFGRIVDRTHSRFGKARPWLLRASLPTSVCLILLFSVPTGLVGVGQIAYVFITYNLANTVCMTMVTLSLYALNSMITEDQFKRSLNSTIYMIFYTVMLLGLNVGMLKLCTFFGAGDVYAPKGWTITVAIFAVAFLVALLIGFLLCKELPSKTYGKSREEMQTKANQPSVFQSIKAVFSNKYWRLYVIAFICNTIGCGLITGTGVYYSQYILGDYNSWSSISAVLYIAMLLGVVATLAMVKKLGKRNTGIIGFSIIIIGCILTAIMPQTAGSTTITMAIRGFGVGFPSAFGPAMLQDSLTYGKWKSGFSMVGIGNAACSFSNKVGSALGTMLLGWILDLSGFDGSAAVQIAGVAGAIKLCFFILPIVFFVIAMIAFILYKLDKEYPQVIADLHAGKFAPGVAAYGSAPAGSNQTE